jgi:hypothetical protein
LTHIYRERDAAVNQRRQALDTAMHSVEQAADPQTEAAMCGLVFACGDDCIEHFLDLMENL